MFERGDEQYLLRAMNRNQVNLFLGAGFPVLATNRLKVRIPTGAQFSELLWQFLGYATPYEQSATLSELYEALITSGKPLATITAFLEDHLLCEHVPPEYDFITTVFWARIFTTNVDNLLEIVYRRVGSPTLDIRSFPGDELAERDATLERIQAVHLHGRLPCNPNDITFSISQFARRATPHDHLYDHFVRDYSTKPTLFIGTALNEPLLFQYIEERKVRRAGIAEERPKSFLICPAITAPRRQLLEAMNVVPVIGGTADFLRWLASKRPALSGRDDVLRITIPGLVELVAGASQGHERDLRAAREFGRHFHSVPTEAASASKDRSLFLLGASPKWEDLLHHRDAPRDVNAQLRAAIEHALLHEPKVMSVLPLLGSAGSGKSTILRRVAIQLAQAGHTCFLTNSEELPRVEDVARALTNIGKKCVLFFDNAETILPALPRLLGELQKLECPPVLAIASRINEFQRVSPRFPEQIHRSELLVPHLSRGEIVAVLAVLDKANLLGRLKGLSQDRRIHEFESKANQQLLVAMREATSGKGFDEIIEDEYNTLHPEEVKTLYLCVALATEAGYRLTLQEFVGCSSATPAETLSYLSRNLRDIVLRTGSSDEFLALRHRRIAEYMIARAAPRTELANAYLRLLGVLSSEISTSNTRSRTFSLFRTLINHFTLHRRFEEDFAQARQIYDSLLARFNSNPQFLLQYGSLEMAADNLTVAQNYLSQAESLDPENAFIQNAMGQLFLKQAIKTPSKAGAIVLRDRGSEILMNNIVDPTLDDAYCYHIYCDLRLAWIRKWGDIEEEKIKELENLRVVSGEAYRKYPGDRRITEVKLEIERDYYSMAIRKS